METCIAAAIIALSFISAAQATSVGDLALLVQKQGSQRV